MVYARFRHDFGPKNVFAVQSQKTDDSDRRQSLVSGLRANGLFAKGVTWTKLASLLGQGAEVHSTQLTEQFDFDDLRTAQGKSAVNLFALDESGRLQVFSDHHELHPAPGWTVINLAPAEETPKERDI